MSERPLSRFLVPIEAIKEIRSGSDVQFYRVQFKFPQDAESRWITINYILGGTYKTLHMVAGTRDIFRLWDTTLRKLFAIRQGLMGGLGNLEMRQTVWERQYWKGADVAQDQKLDFPEVERLCKRLNVNSPTGELERLFKVNCNLGYCLMFLTISSFRKQIRRTVTT